MPYELEPGRPRHEQVSEWLRRQIETESYGPGTQLPSESELCERFGVSRITVRRALQTVEHEGLIYRRQGLGSFVREAPLRQGLVRLTDFAQDLERAGLEATSRVLLHQQEAVAPDVAAFLSLTPGTKVVRLDRLRLGNGMPLAFDCTWLPLFYGQLLEGRDLEQETIYRILERDYEIPVVSGRYRLEAVCADAAVAEAMEITAQHPLLVIKRTSHTVGERPIYFQRRYYRTDRVSFELELARDPGTARSPEGGMPLREFEPVFTPHPAAENP